MVVTVVAIPFHQAIQANGTHLDRQAQGGVAFHLKRQITQQQYQPCSEWRHWPKPQSAGGSKAIPKIDGIQHRMRAPAGSLKCSAGPARIPPPLGSLHGKSSTSHSPLLAA
jgi:hypothetical protein